MTTFAQLEKQPFTFYDAGDQLKNHIYRRSEQYFVEGDRQRDAIRNAANLKKRQTLIRKQFLKGIGGLPASTHPLYAEIRDIRQYDGYRVEKIVYQSRPRVYVTANLYVPDGVTKKTGAVLFVSGHNYGAKHCDEYQFVCQILTKAGLVVLAPDPVGQGERLSYYEPKLGDTTIRWGTEEHEYVGTQCLLCGDSIARYFLHDSMRSIDYLISRPEVDPAKIGVTGNSGGGTQTSMMMLADRRIAAAAPGTFIMNRQTYQQSGGAQDAEQIWPGFTAAGLDHEDILLAMAPKPVMVLAVKYDFFPIEGTRRTVERCRRIWRLLGKEKKLELIEDRCEHKYTLLLARSAARFFAEHLLGNTIDSACLDGCAVPEKDLWCCQSGQVRGEFSDAQGVYEHNIDRLSEIEKERKKAGKTVGMKWLKKRILSNRTPVPQNLRVINVLGGCENLSVQRGFWWSQQDLLSHGLLFRRFDATGAKLPVTIAVWRDGTCAIERHSNWIRNQCATGRAVLVLDVSGCGQIEASSISKLYAPHAFYGTFHKFTDDLLWLNDDLASLRSYDVVRAVEAARQWPGLNLNDISLYGEGRWGVFVRFASAATRYVKKTVVENGVERFADLVRSRYYEPDDVKTQIVCGLLRRLDMTDLTKGVSQ